MKVGSLFTGIGGFDLGFEQAGMEVAWQCEIDKHARAVLAKHWPGAPCYDDVRSIRAGDVPAVDLICGGFPCQDVSYANGTGKGPKGLDGERSGLWKEFARIVGELRPGWVVVENVGALRTRGLITVIRDLDALGYDAEWETLSAAEFGLPHYRERTFIVAWTRLANAAEYPYCGDCGERWCEHHGTHYADCVCRGIRGEAECRECGEWWNLCDSPVCEYCGWNPPDSVRERAQVQAEGTLPAVSLFGRDSSSESIDRRVRRWTAQSPIYRGNDGIPGGLDGRWEANKQLGNAVAVPVAKWIGERIMAAQG